ncbi:virulence RhuM family protein [bacterium SCSIO 12696]|nr:virulence RhuM family protein [bacterium SCSIO 12696]
MEYSKLKHLAGEQQWFSQRQIAQWLQVKTTIVADLIRYLFKTGEFDPDSHCVKQQMVQTEGARQVRREVNCYSRQVVLAVAWRVHSEAGEAFRCWASELLEQQLCQGFTVCEEQLADSASSQRALRSVLEGLPVGNTPCAADSSDGQLATLLEAVHLTLLKLYEFDSQRVTLRNTSMLAAQPLDYFEADHGVRWLRDALFPEGDAGGFGCEKPGQLEALLMVVFGADKPRYSSIEQKAIYLLWLVIHRRPFEEGNVQLAVFLFAWFLQRNGLWQREDGSRRLQNSALVSMALLIARSSDEECDLVVSLLAGLINREN